MPLLGIILAETDTVLGSQLKYRAQLNCVFFVSGIFIPLKWFWIFVLF